MRRDDICIYVGPANRERLEAIIADRNSKTKTVWRARIIHGYLSGLSRPEQVVHFFRRVVGVPVPVLSKEVLSQRTAAYQNWVEAVPRHTLARAALSRPSAFARTCSPVGTLTVILPQSRNNLEICAPAAFLTSSSRSSENAGVSEPTSMESSSPFSQL
jgi:hypothetical protein